MRHLYKKFINGIITVRIYICSYLFLIFRFMNSNYNYLDISASLISFDYKKLSFNLYICLENTKLPDHTISPFPYSFLNDEINHSIAFDTRGFKKFKYLKINCLYFLFIIFSRYDIWILPSAIDGVSHRTLSGNLDCVQIHSTEIIWWFVLDSFFGFFWSILFGKEEKALIFCTAELSLPSILKNLLKNTCGIDIDIVEQVLIILCRLCIYSLFH